MTFAPDAATALARSLLVDAFERVRDEVPQVLDGLAPADATWRPDPDANPIGWLVWHLARVQDDHLAALSGACGRPRPQVWDTWRARFDLPYPPTAIGYRHTSDEVGAFAVADVALLTGYHADVHALTCDVLHELTGDDYARVVDDSWDPPVTAAARLVSVVNDTTAHVGQAAYVRGLLARR